MNTFSRIYSATIASLLLISCSDPAPSTQTTDTTKPKQQTLDSLNFTAEEATEWSALFNRKKGWFGGDGIFAVNLDGKETKDPSDSSKVLIWFSDTMIGEIKDSLQPGFQMINNSAALLEGPIADSAKIKFFWNQQGGKNAALFVPKTPATKKGDYYWLGDGFVNQEKNNDIYIFGLRIRNTGAAVFGFKEVGNTLVIVPGGSKPPFTNYRQIDIPFLTNKESDTIGTLGSGIYVNTKEAGATNADGYVYIYGIKGKSKQVIVSRVKPADIESFDKWTFWDGKQWNSDFLTAAAITDRASNELGVTQLPDGRYALIFQEDAMGKHVGLRLGKTPQGPFGPVIRLWDCSKELSDDKDFLVYNAKIHPVLSKPGELIISYNVNSFDFGNDIKKYPNLYRPRFIRVKIE
jgi:hypothetical protein